MMYRICYSKTEDVTIPGMDGKMFGFHVSYVPMEFLGAPEEAGKTVEHRIVVPIAGTTLAIWSLSEENLTKVLFEFARRILKESLQRGDSFSEFTVRAPMITTGSNPGKCPFDPARIPNPEGFVEEVEIIKLMVFGS